MKTKNKYPLLITLALLAIVGGLLVSQKNPLVSRINPQLTTSDAGFNDIVIQARGTNNKEKIALYINNTPVTFWNLSNNFQDYTYTPNGEITVSELSIHFLNDTWEPENNINYDVQIPYITVNGTTYNSEHQSTLSTGSWDQDNWCAPGNKKTQWLNCNGSFTYDVPQGTVVGLPQVPLSFKKMPQIVDVTSDSATIGFEASGFSAYKLYLDTSDNPTDLIKDEPSFIHSEHLHTFSDLTPSTTYYYKVTLRNKIGDEVTSDITSFRTLESEGSFPIKGFDALLDEGEVFDRFFEETDKQPLNGFGIYQLAVLDKNCIVAGVGQWTAAYDGAALMKYCKNAGITSMIEIPEQGTSSILVSDGITYMPGADATKDRSGSDDCGPNQGFAEQWAWGVSYKWLLGGDIITSCISFGIHVWDMLEVDDALYAVGSGVIPDGVTLQSSTGTGLLFTSSQRAEPGSWVEVANRNNGIGEFRSYRIASAADTLVVQANDSYDTPCYLVKDEGSYQFQRIANSNVRCFHEIYTVNEKVIAIAANGDLLVFDPINNSVERVPFKDDRQDSLSFSVGGGDYLAQDDKYIYIATDDGRIMQAQITDVFSSNDVSWATHAELHSGHYITAIARMENGEFVIAGSTNEFTNLYMTSEGK